MAARRYPDPPFAHVPGRTPRHADDRFDPLRHSVRKGMTSAHLAQSDAWLAGWQFLSSGHFWEAHEVWEAVWLVLPEGSTDRRFVQAAIQTANAELKLAMGRPAATLRLCGIVRDLLDGIEGALGRSGAELAERVMRVEKAANLDRNGAK